MSYYYFGLFHQLYVESTSEDVGSEDSEEEVAEVTVDGQTIDGAGEAPTQNDLGVQMAEQNVDAHQTESEASGGAENQQDTPTIVDPALSTNFDNNPESAATNANFPFNFTESSGTGEQKYFKRYE